MTTNLGPRIAALRKQQRLTQEQLGQRVGVSAQAVSKWENGGAPDVELLPALADSLGTTIDALFGRDENPPEDMAQILDRWLASIPGDQRLHRLYGLLADTWSCAFHPGSLPLRENYPESCYAADPTDSGQTHWLRSRIRCKEGLSLAVLSDNLPFYLLCPTPPEGYRAHFAPDEVSRALFAALAKPGSLEILYALHDAEDKYRTAPAIARLTGLCCEAVEPLLSELSACGLLTRIDLDLDDETRAAYALHDSSAFVPFMLLTRWLTGKNSFLFSYHGDRPALGIPEEP